MTRANQRRFALAVTVLVCAGAGSGGVAFAAPVSEDVLTAQVVAAKTQAEATGGQIVRFSAGGFWDATTQEAYINDGARVARVVKGRLVYKDRGTGRPDGAALVGATSVTTQTIPATCYVTDNLTHCEQVANVSGCNPTSMWLNYDPTADHFSGVYGPPAYAGEYINVRNAPYRRYGPRGVRVFRTGTWGFMSVNCF
jgi:hypothetical protein